MRCPSRVKDQAKQLGVKSYFETVFPKMSSDYALALDAPNNRPAGAIWHSTKAGRPTLR